MSETHLLAEGLGLPESTRWRGNVGPAPVQDPGPSIWIGAATPGGIQRATEIADAFVFPQRCLRRRSAR